LFVNNNNNNNNNNNVNANNNNNNIQIGLLVPAPLKKSLRSNLQRRHRTISRHIR